MDRTTRILRQHIFDGTWPVGERLPPERELAQQLEVNRLTLRAALTALQAQGLVRARQGDGVRVLDPRFGGGLELVSDLIAAGRSDLVPDLFMLRRAVAAEAVAAACLRATEPERQGLLDLALAQQQELEPQAFLQRDLEFARALVRAAHSLPMELMLNAFSPLYRDHPHLAAALYAQVEPVRRSYHGVNLLLAGRDPSMAREAVRSTLELIDATTVANLENV